MVRISLKEAATRLQAGAVVGIPTETVYGLAASLECRPAIHSIFEIKGRPRVNPLIVHVADIAQARRLSRHWTDQAESLARLWPGPLTLIVEADPDLVPLEVRAGLATVGLRIPRHELCQELLRLTGPLVAPSANLSGRPSASAAEHVEQDFGGEFPVLDGGACLCGLESTIVTTGETPQIARLGAWSREDLEAATGLQILAPAPLGSATRPICPGQMFQHYAPRARLRRLSQRRESGPCIVLGFRDRDYGEATVWPLAPRQEPAEVARQLYDLLRRLDQASVQEAWIDDRIPGEGLWATIAERIARASLVEARRD
jgi:L-threonylcarbamoyladenylate synthase